MWKPLQKSPPYFIKFTKEAANFYNVSVTDYKRFWLINTSKKSFLADLKESNNTLEFDDENELIERGQDMIINPESLSKVTILQEENGKTLAISMKKVYECPLKLELSLPEASNEYFFSAVVQPLLKTVCDLHASQNELRQLLMGKNKEIQAYKKSGKPARREITAVYNDASHMAKHKIFEENFGAPKVSDLLKSVADQNHIQVPSKTSTIAKGTEQKSLAQSTRVPSSNSIHSEDIPMKQTKIEKASQNSLIDAIPTIAPSQIDENEIPPLVIRPPSVRIDALNSNRSLAPPPMKRLKKKLNY